MKIGIAKNKKKIFINLNNKNIEIHPLWLRERVNNAEYLDQNNGQRLYDPSELNKKLKIKKAFIKNKYLNVQFTDGTNSDYEIQEIFEELNKSSNNKNILLWNSKLKMKPIFKYKKRMFKEKEGYKFLKSFYKYGFGIVKNLPKKKNIVTKFASSIGIVRSTNFGTFFNVQSVNKAKDLAYTSHHLAAHTDNPYRKPIPGIQLLHCIKNDSEGGRSTLTDGFAVAEYLRKKYPSYFKLLSSVKIRFIYQSDNTYLENWGETIEIDRKGFIKIIRLSPRLDYVPVLKKEKLNQFYNARSFFIKLCNSKKFNIEFKLSPGDIMVMDNYRTLHGRTSYNMNIGERHLQGCYIDHDSTESKMRYLKRKLNINE
tara:strand:+ start:4658 stop:5764 length:1107 start_codon:yes stop_codon:yes gene_type:complete